MTITNKKNKWEQVIKYSYLTNKDSSNRIVKKLGKSIISIKSKLRRNNIFDKLVLTIYRLENSQHAQ